MHRPSTEPAPILVRVAGPEDVAALDGALRRLSDDLGDRHRATAADLAAAGFGPIPAYRAALAEREGRVAGVAMVSPVFSTTLGGPGGFVSDLWVAAEARGAGLGRRLLVAARDAAAAGWGARFLRIGVYADNARAAALYARLGFVAASEDRIMVAGPEALASWG